jgi:hypothetical protein
MVLSKEMAGDLAGIVGEGTALIYMWQVIPNT